MWAAHDVGTEWLNQSISYHPRGTVTAARELQLVRNCDVPVLDHLPP